MGLIMKLQLFLVAALCLITQPSMANPYHDQLQSMQPKKPSFLEGVAQGFLETSNENMERRRCEETYSPAMCAQMEADRQQKAAQEWHNQQTEEELRQMQWQMNQLEQENYNQRQQLNNMKRNGQY